MAKKTLAERKADKLAELERIKAELAAIETLAAERIGKLALAAGLDALELDDAVLRREFEAIVAKFHRGQGQRFASDAAAASTH